MSISAPHPGLILEALLTANYVERQTFLVMIEMRTLRNIKAIYFVFIDRKCMKEKFYNYFEIQPTLHSPQKRDVSEMQQLLNFSPSTRSPLASR